MRKHRASKAVAKVFIGVLGMAMAHAATAVPSEDIRALVEAANLDPSGPAAVPAPDPEGVAALEVGDKVIIRAPEITWTLSAHAAGQIQALDDEQLTIEVEKREITPYAQTELGRLIFESDTGSRLTAPKELARPYSDELWERFRVMDRYAFEAISPDERAPEYYNVTNRLVRTYVGRLVREMQNNGLSLDVMPEIEAGLAFRERLVDHIEENGGYSTLDDAINDDPTIVSRIGFQVLDDYGYLDFARSLFEANEIRLPFSERKISEVWWELDTESEAWGVIAPAVVIDILAMSHSNLVWKLDAEPEAENVHRELAGLMVDYLDGARQEGSREEQIDALIAVTRERMENL